MTRVDARRTPIAADLSTPAGGGAREARRLFLAAAWITPPPETLERVSRHLDDASAWEDAAAIARHVGQEPLFLRFVEMHAPGAPLARETLLDLENQSRLHAFRWEEIRHAAAAVIAALEREGIRPVLLKGLAHAGERYHPPHLRPMRDIDLLVGPSEALAALAAAEASGFASDPVRHPAHRYDRHHHLPPIFHRETGICLEIHHSVMRLPADFGGFPPVEEFLRAVRQSRIFPGRALVLEPSLEVLLTAIHITNGDSIGRRTHNLVDLARVIESEGPRIDWDRLLRHARSPHVAAALAVPLLYLAGEGLASAPPEVRSRLCALSGLREGELALLRSLSDRYRFGAPAPWPLVSGRISNVLWRQALRRAPLPFRAARALWEILAAAPKRP